MELKNEMMVYAYGLYLEKEKDLKFSTVTSHKNKAQKYYENPDQNTRPPHLEEAEKLIKSL